jgi:YVTN family beta-propeller protein
MVRGWRQRSIPRDEFVAGLRGVGDDVGGDLPQPAAASRVHGGCYKCRSVSSPIDPSGRHERRRGMAGSVAAVVALVAVVAVASVVSVRSDGGDSGESATAAGDGARAQASRRRATEPLDVYAHTRSGMLSAAVVGHRKRVYVPNSESNTVSVIDPRKLEVVDTFPVGALPHHVTPSHDLKTLYVCMSTTRREIA